MRGEPRLREDAGHVGDQVALIVAESVVQAKDAAELIEVDYDELPAVMDVAGAHMSGSQVHDEVLLEVPDAEQDAVGPLTVATMRGAAELRVPLEVNVSSGPTWADAKG